MLLRLSLISDIGCVNADVIFGHVAIVELVGDFGSFKRVHTVLTGVVPKILFVCNSCA